MHNPGAQTGFQPRGTETEQIKRSAARVVTDIVQLSSRAQVEAVDDEHVWTPALIDMRFNYRPENPLYLLLLRAYRLHEPQTIANTPAYAGCKSWVPLDQPVDLGDALPVLDDVKYDVRRKSILQRIQ